MITRLNGGVGCIAAGASKIGQTDYRKRQASISIASLFPPTPSLRIIIAPEYAA